VSIEDREIADAGATDRDFAIRNRVSRAPMPVGEREY
jgi:hypothetical protein